MSQNRPNPRVFLVTGASTGIGAAIAGELASPETHILVHYHRSRDEAEAVVRCVAEKGGQGTLLQADLSCESGCAALAEQVSEATEHLDGLVNNAGGIIRRAAADDLEWDLMEDTFRLNVFSAMKLTSDLIPLLRKGRDPSVIFLSSIAMRHGAPTAVIYGAAKAALDSLTRGLAKELAPAIRVNAVAPGVIDTPFHDGQSSPEQFAAWKEATPLKMIGRVEHIAPAVRLLIDNTFMTGETIDVNGGLFMR